MTGVRLIMMVHLLWKIQPIFNLETITEKLPGPVLIRNLTDEMLQRRKVPFSQENAMETDSSSNENILTELLLSGGKWEIKPLLDSISTSDRAANGGNMTIRHRNIDVAGSNDAFRVRNVRTTTKYNNHSSDANPTNTEDNVPRNVMMNSSDSSDVQKPEKRHNNTVDKIMETEMDVTRNLLLQEFHKLVGYHHRDYAKYAMFKNLITNAFPDYENNLCYKALEQLYLNIDKEFWALSMLDSSGKIPEGILQGNIYAWGNWYQCLDIVAKIPPFNISAHPVAFQGQYCLIKFPLFNSTESIDTNNGFLPILRSLITPSIALCIPSVCSSEELTLALSTIVRSVPTPKVECHVKEGPSVPFSAGEISVITIFSITGTLIILGSGLSSIRSSLPTTTRVFGKFTNTVSTLGDILQVFSIQSNFKKLFDISSKSDTLTCLHGIRFLSMSWVILGHSYVFLIVGKQRNIVHAISYLNDLAFSIISNSTVSVDSFFFLSGLLVTYIAMKKMALNEGKFNIVYFYLHRYIRLTPVLMMIIAFDATLYARLGSGPNWTDVETSPLSNYNGCKLHWWKNLLYINNFLQDSACLGQTWYLANDMQMYLFSPIILLPLYHRPIVGQILIVSLIFIFTSVNGIVTYQQKLGPFNFPTSPEGGDPFSTRYVKPWTRVAPYLVGMFIGWLLFRIRGRDLRIPLVVRVTGWILASATACLVIFGPHDYLRQDALSVDPSPSVSVIYSMLHRTAWSLCLAWLVVACTSGHGGIVNNILSWRVFIPLSRLTYVSYLVSIDVQMYFWFTSKSPVYIDHQVVIMLFLSHLLMILALAVLLSLAFEFPVLSLEKLIRRNNDKIAEETLKTQFQQNSTSIRDTFVS